MLTPLQSLSEAPNIPTLAVIINCGTKWVSSLALLSTLAHTDCPVLVINCESKDGSRVHFEWLAHTYQLNFFWLDWPLRPHPITLDNVFREVRSDLVLLVDSDLELRNRRLFDTMRSAVADYDAAYGAGFLHGPNWLGSEHGLPPYTGYYAERMWIPFVLLRTTSIRWALSSGFSFANRRPFLEIPRYQTLSRLIGYRFRIRGLRRLRLPTLRAAVDVHTVEVEGRRPAFVEYDTGADLHKALNDHGYRFAGLPAGLWGDVHHYHGVTRANLAGIVRRVAKGLRLASIGTETQQTSVLTAIQARLLEAYGIQAENRTVPR